MATDLQIYRSIDDIYEELQSKYSVPHFEALKLAVQIQRNEILALGLNKEQTLKRGFLDK